MDKGSEIALIESVWEGIRQHLANERHRVNEEIRNYPSPIPACDAQFTYLLEERSRLAQELARLEGSARECLTRTDCIKRIGEFMVSSNYINSEMEQRIRSSLLGVSRADFE